MVGVGTSLSVSAQDLLKTFASYYMDVKCHCHSLLVLRWQCSSTTIKSGDR